MTAAIDRFLYRATADAVAERLTDAKIELEGALWDLASARECSPTKQTLIAHIDELVAQRDAAFAALDAAAAYVSDFVEANRP